jgi:hypothetical protein
MLVCIAVSNDVLEIMRSLRAGMSSMPHRNRDHALGLLVLKEEYLERTKDTSLSTS